MYVGACEGLNVKTFFLKISYFILFLAHLPLIPAYEGCLICSALKNFHVPLMLAFVT